MYYLILPLEGTALEARIDWLRTLTPQDAVEAIVATLAGGSHSYWYVWL